MADINVYGPQDTGDDFQVWVDTEELSRDGTILGTHETSEYQALVDAEAELRRLLGVLLELKEQADPLRFALEK